MILSAAGGFICFVLAQNLLLRSRQPVPPLLFAIVGVVGLLPMLSYYNGIWFAPIEITKAESSEAIEPPAPALPNRTLYGVGGVFFTALSVLLAQSGQTSPLLLFSWIVGVLLLMIALYPAAAGFKPLRVWNSLNQYIQHLYDQQTTLIRLWSEVWIVMILMAVTAFIQRQTPKPTDANVTPAGAFAVALVLTVYLCGRVIDGPLTGLIAGSFAAVSGWTLALGKMDGPYSAAAMMSALYCGLVWRAAKQPNRILYLLAGLALGIGALIWSPFLYLGLLIPIVILLRWWAESRLDWRNFLAAFIIATAVILPPALAPRPSTQPTIIADTPLSPASTFLDGLSSSLLMFNLTSDPNALHGIVDRPVFAPLLAGAFVVGLIGWALRLNTSRKWSDALLIIALVVALLPSAILIQPPPRYPDLQRAAMALPIAMIIAAFGTALVARFFRAWWGQAGLALAAGLLLLGLVITATDANQHYRAVFIPAYEQAAPAYNGQ
jgi:hypothetical protein